jgi:hypothetical protein
MLTAEIGRWLTGPKAAQAGEGSAGPGPRCGLGAVRAVREAGSWAGFARWAEWLALRPKWPCFILFLEAYLNDFFMKFV